MVHCKPQIALGLHCLLHVMSCADFKAKLTKVVLTWQAEYLKEIEARFKGVHQSILDQKAVWQPCFSWRCTAFVSIGCCQQPRSPGMSTELASLQSSLVDLDCRIFWAFCLTISQTWKTVLYVRCLTFIYCCLFWLLLHQLLSGCHCHRGICMKIITLSACWAGGALRLVEIMCLRIASACVQQSKLTLYCLNLPPLQL